ncbi:MAG TPA: helix-turn-helix domain-containing protein [Anaerolineales bacterium]|nr:helix-turn-helix domain-containing protein [Anaerolineales bacterium]
MANDSLLALQKLGFAEYEARVYLALLAHNPATGYQIGVRAGVPRSMVYEALGRLEARGAVLRSGDRRATRYRPVPPEAFLDRLAREQEGRLSTLRQDLVFRYQKPDDDRLWTGRGLDLIDSLASQIIDTASSELLSVIGDDELSRFGLALRRACQRNVRLGTVVAGQSDAPCGFSVRHPPVESELQQLDRLLLIVRDAEEVLIADLRSEGTATLTTNSHMVHIAAQFVWMELLTQRLVSSGAPDPLASLSDRDRRELKMLGTRLRTLAAPQEEGSRGSDG